MRLELTARARLRPIRPSARARRPAREERAAFWLTLDAINFGSGWFPTLRKRDGRSGYHTIAAGLRERFAAHGPGAPRRCRGSTPRRSPPCSARTPATS